MSFNGQHPSLLGVVLAVVSHGGLLLATNQITPGSLMSFLIATQTIQRLVGQWGGWSAVWSFGQSVIWSVCHLVSLSFGQSVIWSGDYCHRFSLLYLDADNMVCQYHSKSC